MAVYGKLLQAGKLICPYLGNVQGTSDAPRTIPTLHSLVSVLLSYLLISGGQEDGGHWAVLFVAPRGITSGWLTAVLCGLLFHRPDHREQSVFSLGCVPCLGALGLPSTHLHQAYWHAEIGNLIGTP